MSSFFVLTRLLVAICALSAAGEARPEPDRVVLELFTREGCPHCEEAKREGRWLKLVSGAAMVGLGVYLLVGPSQ
jgi:hypothetical protein